MNLKRKLSNLAGNAGMVAALIGLCAVSIGVPLGMLYAVVKVISIAWNG